MMYLDLLIAICFFIFFYRVGMYEYRSWLISVCMGIFSVILLIVTDFGGILLQLLVQGVYFFSLGFVKDIQKWLKKRGR